MKSVITQPNDARSAASSIIAAAFCAATLLVLQPLDASAKPEPPAPTDLRGEAAVAHLKQTGAYESLGEALTAARYRVETDERGRRVMNDANGFQVSFAGNGWQLSSAQKDKAWVSSWRLRSFGYGNEQALAADGSWHSAVNRVELRRESQQVTEWFVNSPQGVEHGFTLTARPGTHKGGAPLRLVMELDGDLTARADENGQELTLRESSGVEALRYKKLKVWDARGTELMARMRTEGGGEVWLEVDDSTAEYPVTIDPTFVEQQKLTASDGGEEAQFGSNVAISGDTAVVHGGGQPYTLGHVFRGAVYIFVRTGTTWTEQQRLLPIDSNEYGFGSAVAISGNTVAVHAAKDSSEQSKVYIYVRTDTTWTLQQTLASPAPGFYDGFGDAIALAGDTLVVGEYRYNSGLEAFMGSAHIYVRNGTAWTRQQTVTGDGIRDNFAGNRDSIAISGDTFVVGAFGGWDETDDPSAYVFVRNGTTWTRQQRLRASDHNYESYFGRSVGISGDTIIVGASHGYYDYGQAGSEGSAYIFQRNGTTWTQQQKLTADDGVQRDFLGWDVAISGDTAVVGTLYANAAYIFTRCGGTWTQRQKFTGVSNSQYGETVAISGVTAIIGARAEDIGANVRQGAAYLLRATDLNMTSAEVQAAAEGCQIDIKVNITSDEADSDLADNVCDVDPNEDGEQCSLRAALQTANANAGTDFITFDIPGGGVQTISPGSTLPLITEKVSINATTQPGYSGAPVIELRGSGAADYGLGFDTGSNDSSVLGLAINRFVRGIAMKSSGNRVERCYIGLSTEGTAAGSLGAQQVGVLIATATATNNTIGGAGELRNVISNNQVGVAISEGASGNKVLGNRIGTNAAGIAAIPNGAGVAIEGANSNRIGDDTVGTGNLISGNASVGVAVGAKSSDNLIVANQIGTNAAGTEAIPNLAGVLIEDSSNNRVGTDTGEQGNLLSGNTTVGIALRVNSSNNLIAGNKIGTKANGTQVLPNGQHGVFLDTGATTNILKLNVIGGHDLTDNSTGIIFGPETGPNNLVTGNSIGVVANLGMTALPNRYGIANFADRQIIGSQDGGNFVSHNTKAGIWLAGVPGGPNPVVEGNVVQYNYAGTNGTDDLGNGEFGIWLAGEADNNSIARNVVSGNDGFGIALTDGPSTNSVQENIIGTNTSGTSAIANGGGIWIRQATDNMVQSNLVSGNAVGILVGTNIGFGETGAAGNHSGGTYTSGNRLSGNVVGLNAARNAAIPGSVIGIAIGEHARNNFIGGTSGLYGSDYNLISGITQGSGMGVLLGTLAPSPSEEALPQFNTVQGNIIGLSGDLRATISNTKGFVLVQAARNTIGGTTPASANIIVASTEEGVALLDGTRENTFLKNFLGVLPPGFGSQTNRPSAASQNTSEISATSASTGTYGNGGHGILVANGAQGNILGGADANSSMVIANNGGYGINLASTAGSGNVIGANSIFGNALGGIDLGGDGFTANDPGDADVGPNNLQNYPELVSCSIVGGDLIVSYHVDSAPENSNYGSSGIHVEFFEADSTGEGRSFVGSDYYTANDYTSGTPGTRQRNLGNAAALGIGEGDLLTSGATDADGNSSEFTPAVTVTLAPSPIPTRPLQLLNIATRLNVQTGENVLIGGVIVTGTEPKKVIIRAIGPSLSEVFDGVLSDPALELYEGDTLLASNDNWRDVQQAEIEETTIPPSHDLESAIVYTLAPGFYTAVMSGQDGKTGIGVIEVYDLDQAADSKLANIASRGFVEAGDSVMIGGLIVGGNGTEDARILLRAIGPSLGNAGVADALQDPTLELRDANGELVRENDNWEETQQAEIEATTIPPSDPAESAIVATLPPGNYTAVVRGSGETTGVGLVEVYNVP